ncbi:response regulator [Roseicella sp. DB1501]|uniref:response regulator n=1 Tax=Roseicella sp. DB1501 TaxID=2730925 RepID=UPI00149277C9|nr:response regulator [Roseicella sp. DB1501]
MCILVVEDDTLIRMILVEELVDAGFSVQEAGSGDQAIASLETLGREPQVLVTDVHMPGEHDGLALASHVRSRWPTVPVIFTTGRPDALQRLEKLDARQVLVRKPYVPNDIIACIQQLGAAPAGLSNDTGGA